MPQNILICLLVLQSNVQAKACFLRTFTYLHRHHLSVTASGAVGEDEVHFEWKPSRAIFLRQALAPRSCWHHWYRHPELHFIPFSCFRQEVLLRNAPEVGREPQGKESCGSQSSAPALDRIRVWVP